jgi:acyl-CoA thioesterase-1
MSRLIKFIFSSATRLILRDLAFMTPLLFFAASSRAAEVVALGASNTYGQGVERGEDFPAQLEKLLHVKGFKVSVANAGVSGETTDGMRARLDAALSTDTRVLLLQPGGNDSRHGMSASQTQDNVASIKAAAAARHIRVVMVPNPMFRGLPHQSDGMHLTPEGYRTLAEELEASVASALRR